MHMPRKWKRPKKNVFKWTKINAEPFNTPTLTISDNFSINKSHQGPFQRLTTKKKKYPKFCHFLLLTSAQLYNYKTSSQPFLDNFPEILYVLRCLSQNKKFLTWKMAEPQRPPSFFPIIISAQGRMVCWLVGGKCVKRKLAQVNIRQFHTVLNIKIDQYKQLFNQQKSSQASWDGSDRASEDPRFSTFWRLVRWLRLNYTIMKLQASPS